MLAPNAKILISAPPHRLLPIAQRDERTYDGRAPSRVRAPPEPQLPWVFPEDAVSRNSSLLHCLQIVGLLRGIGSPCPAMAQKSVEFHKQALQTRGSSEFPASSPRIAGAVYALSIVRPHRRAVPR